MFKSGIGGIEAKHDSEFFQEINKVSEEAVDCPSCGRKTVYQLHTHEWVCKACGHYCGYDMVSDWNDNWENTVKTYKYDREKYVSRIFTWLIKKPIYIPRDVFECVSNHCKAKESTSWSEITRELRSRDNHKPSDIYYAPSILGFDWEFDEKWLKTIEFVTLNWIGKSAPNKVYLLKQAVKLHTNGKGGDWVPVYLTDRTIKEHDKVWAKFCAIHNWPLYRLGDSKLNLSTAKPKQFEYGPDDDVYLCIDNIMKINKMQKSRQGYEWGTVEVYDYDYYMEYELGKHARPCDTQEEESDDTTALETSNLDDFLDNYEDADEIDL